MPTLSDARSICREIFHVASQGKITCLQQGHTPESLMVKQEESSITRPVDLVSIDGGLCLSRVHRSQVHVLQPRPFIHASVDCDSILHDGALQSHDIATWRRRRTANKVHVVLKGIAARQLLAVNDLGQVVCSITPLAAHIRAHLQHKVSLYNEAAFQQLSGCYSLLAVQQAEEHTPLTVSGIPAPLAPWGGFASAISELPDWPAPKEPFLLLTIFPLPAPCTQPNSYRSWLCPLYPSTVYIPGRAASLQSGRAFQA